MIIECNRNSKEGHDDAHQLNRLVCKNVDCFSPEFVQEWHQAYGAFCKDREDIRLTHGQSS